MAWGIASRSACTRQSRPSKIKVPTSMAILRYWTLRCSTIPDWLLGVTGSGRFLPGQANGTDQLLVQFEPDGVVRVDKRPGQPGGLAGLDFAQCHKQFRRIGVQPR